MTADKLFKELKAAYANINNPAAQAYTNLDDLANSGEHFFIGYAAPPQPE